MAGNDRRLLIEVIGDASSAERMFGRLGAQSQTLEKQLQHTGKTLTTHLTLPLVGAGVAAVKTADDFNLSMAKIQGLVGASSKQIADALYFVTSAGIKGADAIKVLTAAAKASTAGLGDTKTIADALTSAINAYGKGNLSASKAADILTAAVREGKMEASSLAPVLGNILPIASRLHVSFGDVAASIAAMSRNGTDAATGATQLSAFFNTLLKDTPATAKALASVGLSASGLRQELADHGLLATLQTLDIRFGDNLATLSKVFPNIRALRGELGLTGPAAKQTAEIFDGVNRSTGAMGRAFDAVAKTDAFKAHQAVAQLQADAVKLGDTLAPVAEKIVHDVDALARAFNNLSPGEKDVLIRLAEAAAVAGPLVMFTGRVMTIAGALAKLGAAAGEAGAAGRVALLLGRLRALKMLGPIATAITVYEIVRKITGSNADLSQNTTTPDNYVTGVYKGKQVAAVMGSPLGNDIAALNAGRKLTKSQTTELERGIKSGNVSVGAAAAGVKSGGSQYAPLYGSALQSYIAEAATAAGLDPQAVLAVASAEGGFSGTIGDKGTSFGPFQLHVGGALPKGQGYGFAQSKSGVDYAIKQMAGLAAGKTGIDAVAAIVHGFERPADGGAGDISRAAAYLRGHGSSSEAAVSGDVAIADDLRRALSSVIAADDDLDYCFEQARHAINWLIAGDRPGELYEVDGVTGTRGSIHETGGLGVILAGFRRDGRTGIAQCVDGVWDEAGIYEDVHGWELSGTVPGGVDESAVEAVYSHARGYGNSVLSGDVRLADAVGQAIAMHRRIRELDPERVSRDVVVHVLLWHDTRPRRLDYELDVDDDQRRATIYADLTLLEQAG